MVDDDKVDDGWGGTEDKDQPTKPKRGTPPVLRLDSSSQFEKADPSTQVRRQRKSVLDLADGAEDLSLAPEPSEALDLVAAEADRETPIAPVAPPPPRSSAKNVDPLQDMRERLSLGDYSLEQILDVSGMPTLDALRILYELLQQRVIGFR